MSRGARLLWPLLIAGFMTVVHWAVEGNPGVISGAKIDHKSLVRITEFFIYVSLAFFVVRLIDLLVFDLITRKRNVKAPVLLREIVSILLFAIFLAWAASVIFNARVTAFLAGGTVVAAVLGLALQETLGNLFAGIALHLEDSFATGDVIHSGEHIGVVEAVRWRGTRIRTFTNSIVVVPNSLLARAHLEIFPLGNLNGRVLQIGVDYNVPPSVAINVLTLAASHVDGVSRQVPAFARVASFGDSSVIYDIKYHMTDYSRRDQIDADIRKAVWYALRRNAIPIPFPIRTHIRYQPPASRAQPGTEDIVLRLAGIDLLTPVPPDAKTAIAEAALIHTFAKGETIIRRATAGNSMFVLHDGKVSVRVADDEVAQLGAGDVFGEMALLTGENRTASVVALTDVIAIEITKEALQPVLLDHPELAQALSMKVAERRGTLDSLSAQTNEDAQRTVLSRIRAYFGL